MKLLAVCYMSAMLFFSYYNQAIAETASRTESSTSDSEGSSTSDANSEEFDVPPPLLAPIEFIVRPVSNTELMLTWDRPNGEEDGYRVLKSSSFDGPFTEIATTGKNEEVYVDEVGMDGSAYYQIEAFKGVDVSLSAIEFGTTMAFSGRALGLDGIEDYLDAQAPLLSTSDGGESFTFEAWIRTSAAGLATIFSQYVNTGVPDPNNFLIRVADGGALQVVKGATTMAQGVADVATGEWRHVAVVKQDNGFYSIYVDGQLDVGGSVQDLAPFPDANALLGAHIDLGAETDLLPGDIDEVKIYNVEKTDFSDRYLRPNLADTTLWTCYTFDEGVVTNWVDRSLSEFNAIQVGGATAVTPDFGADIFTDPLKTTDTSPGITGTTDIPASLSSYTIEVTVDGSVYSPSEAAGTWSIGSGTIAALTEGVYSVDAVILDDFLTPRAVDVSTEELIVDLTAPNLTFPVTFNTNEVSPTLNGNITMVDDWDLPMTVQVILPSGTYDATVFDHNPSTKNAKWTIDLLTADGGSAVILPEGTSAATIRIFDDVGNSRDRDSDIVVDITAPVVAIANLTTNNTSPEIMGTVDDPDATVNINVDGSDYGATNNGDGTWTLPGNTIAALLEGIYEVVVTAVDDVGNVGTDGTADELQIDLTAPTVAVDVLITNDDSPALTGTVDDPDATINVNVDGSDYAAVNNGDGTWTLADNTVAALAEGVFEVIVTATDVASNVNSDGTSDELTVDVTAPMITIDPLTSSDNTPTITGTIDDGSASIQLMVDGEVYVGTNTSPTWTVDVTIPLDDGTYNILISATDPAGNTGQDATADELTLENTMVIPTVTVDLLETLDFTPALSGTVDDEVATLQVTVNGVSYAATNNANGTWILADDVIAALPVDTYDVLVEATSASDLVGTDNTGAELRILPSATILSDAQDITTNSFTISWTELQGGVASYVVEISDVEDFSVIVTSYQVLDGDGASVVVSGLDYGKNYYSRAKVIYQSGDNSEYSNTVLARTQTDPNTALDSLALVTIYDLTGGAEWNNSTNWKAGRLDTWFGVTVEDARVTKVDLKDNNLQGAIGDIASGLSALMTLDMAENDLTDIGDLTPLTALQTADVSQNRLPFGAFQNLEATGAVVTFDSQGELLEQIVTRQEQGVSYVFDRAISGTGNVYQWYKNGALINFNNASFALDITSFDQEGSYHAEVTNVGFPGVILVTRPIVLKVSSLERDRASLLEIYEATGGDSWTNGADWSNNPNVDTWIGVTVANNRVTQLNLENSNVSGEISDALLDIVNLEFLDLSGNSITRIPDLRELSALTAPDVSDNLLDFGDLEGNAEIPSINYLNQRPSGEATETRIPKGSNHTISVNIGGTANNYEWTLKGTTQSKTIEGAKSDSYTVQNINYDNMGDYMVLVTNPLVPALAIMSKPQTVLATTDLRFQPTYVDIDGETAILDEGDGYLIKVTEPGQPFDTLDTQELTGTDLLFPEVVLGDYLVSVRTDTLLLRDKGGRTDSVRLLPSYYRSTFLWEEADTLFVREGLEKELQMQRKPTNVEKGGNAVNLLVESDFVEGNDAGARVQARRKVKRAGCSLRRRRRATGGRGFNELEDYELIAYKETDDNGRVSFGDLPDGDYRLNIEYPGIPMDPNSFIEFKIGEGGLEENSLTLEATVDETGIEVELVEILRIIKEYFEEINVYPNPADRDLNIAYRGLDNDGVQAQLMDLQGRLIIEQELPRSSDRIMTMDVSTLEEGLYLLRLIDARRSEGIVVFKVLVDR